jgi:hypothetical protein
VDVIAPVIAAVHLNGNAPVGVIGPVDDRRLTPTKRIDPGVNGVDHLHGGVPVQVHDYVVAVVSSADLSRLVDPARSGLQR